MRVVQVSPQNADFQLLSRMTGTVKVFSDRQGALIFDGLAVAVQANVEGVTRFSDVPCVRA